MQSNRQNLVAPKTVIKVESATVIVELAFLAIGILIGINWRNEYAERKESRSIEQIDESIRNELAVAKNLNKSLLDDVKFLRAKLQRAQNKNDK